MASNWSQPKRASKPNILVIFCAGYPIWLPPSRVIIAHTSRIIFMHTLAGKSSSSSSRVSTQSSSPPNFHCAIYRVPPAIKYSVTFARFGSITLQIVVFKWIILVNHRISGSGADLPIVAKVSLIWEVFILAGGSGPKSILFYVS